MSTILEPGSVKWPQEAKCHICGAVHNVWIEDLFKFPHGGKDAAFLCKECMAIVMAGHIFVTVENLLTFEEWRQKYLLK